MPIIAASPSTDFIVGEDSFDDLEIKQGEHGFYYFRNSKKTLVKHFVVKQTKATQKRCRITLICKEEGKFEPRFDFEILDRKNECSKQIQLIVHEQTRDVKAKVDFSDCHHEFSQLLAFLEGFEGITLGEKAFAVVPAAEKAQLSEALEAAGKDAAVQEMANRFGSKITEKDISLLAGRRKALEHFRKMLEEPDVFEEYRKKLGENTKPESLWQLFFERNTWIFGYGLQLVSCQNLDNHKLETIVVGSDIIDGAGKRTDALLKTRGRISKTLFGEIKIHTTPLLKKYPRSSVFIPSDDLSGAIGQLQKGIHKVSLKLTEVYKQITDSDGYRTGEELYFIRPKGITVVGRLSEFETPNGLNREMLASFELFRQQLVGIEVLTFDELYERTKFIVED